MNIIYFANLYPIFLSHCKISLTPLLSFLPASSVRRRRPATERNEVVTSSDLGSRLQITLVEECFTVEYVMCEQFYSAETAVQVQNRVQGEY
jgi:hypothetical protein